MPLKRLDPFDVYERIVTLGGTPPHAERVAAMRHSFEARTGAFRPEDRWFEARSRAFWDDAVTTQGFARVVAGELPAEADAWTGAFGRAHRGLFRVEASEEGTLVLCDVWGGAEFVVDAADDGTREALVAAREGQGLFDARLVAVETSVAMLPGAVFHPEDATVAIEAVLGAAHARAPELATDEVLDALLRMERNLRSLSRVKAGYAYRVEALAAKPH